MFVATGLCGVAPLIHGLNVFGMSQMMRKAFPYTLAKAGCLLSGTFFYAVSLLFPGKRELTLKHVSLKDQVSRKSISWQI
jgi:adiponectin receptor